MEKQTEHHLHRSSGDAHSINLNTAFMDEEIAQ